jgi:uncharacterized protein (DUF302 family)
MISYGFTKETNFPFEKAIKVVTEALKREGFGILTEIDVKEKLKEKLGIDFKRYKILGACNPPNAHKALLVEENIGLRKGRESCCFYYKADCGHVDDR